MYYQAYAVKNRRQEDEQRQMIDFTPDKKEAELSIRNAIASGFDYGYIKQEFLVVQSYNESSFIKHE